MLPRVAATVERFGMLTRGERVLIAVSGGPDSVALLHVFLALRPAHDLTLHVVHVNHHLRAEASEDARFVLDLARAVNLPATITDVGEAPARGESRETWARRVRYHALDAVAAQVGAGRIAVGHTADDQAETVLMRFLQGAGPRGLAGIPPVRGPFIRPLIDISRVEILSFLKGIGARWVEDRTNADLNYLRNRLRLHLIPELTRYNPNARSALRRVATHCREASEALATLGKALRAASAERERFHLASDGSTPSGIVKEALRQWLELLLGRPLREVHLEALARLSAKGARGRVRLPGGAFVERDGSDLRFSREGERAPVWSFMPDVPLRIPGRTELPWCGLAVETTLCPAQMTPIPEDPWSAAFDWEALDHPLCVRSRRPGDRFRPFGFAGTKSLKKFFNEARVPVRNRDRVPLVLAGGEIVWILGHRRGAMALLTAGSRRALLLRARRIQDEDPEAVR